MEYGPGPVLPPDDAHTSTGSKKQEPKADEDGDSPSPSNLLTLPALHFRSPFETSD
jgi:hypothetical protein